MTFGIAFDDVQSIMRWSALILVSLCLAGCASQLQQQQAPPSPELQAVAVEEPADAVLASALMFDPPVTLDEPPLSLAREPRERSAFVAFEDQTQTFSWIHIDDFQSGDGPHGRGRYERRALIDRVGSSVR